MEFRNDLEHFTRELHARLEVGEREYGGASFTAAPTSLIGELQQEALDIAGWGFILWRRLEAFRRRLDAFVDEHNG